MHVQASAILNTFVKLAAYFLNKSAK